MRDLFPASVPVPAPAPAATQTTFTLEPPPRAVPDGIRNQLMFGGAVNQVGWFFLGLGLVCFWFLGLNSEIWSYALFAGQTEHATGLVTAVNDTHSSENERRIQAVEYVYSVAGTEHRGTSYTTATSTGAGAMVDIEYRKGSPQISRIRGMRRYRFSVVAFACVIFPLAGLIVVARGLRRGLHDIKVLTRGREAMGVLVSKEVNGVEVNGQPMYDLTFRFRTEDGAEHRGVVSALHTIPIEDEPEERLLYDPRHPERVVVIDNLPGAASIDAQGRLIGGNSGALVLVMPGLAAAALLALLFFA